MAFPLNMKRTGARAAALALLAGAGVFAAAPAWASPGQSTCVTNDQIGTLCVTETSTGYDAQFADTGVFDVDDFNLWITKGPVGDQGAFDTEPGAEYTYFFATGDQSVAHLCLYSRDNLFSPLCTPNLYN